MNTIKQQAEEIILQAEEIILKAEEIILKELIYIIKKSDEKFGNKCYNKINN